MFTSVFKNILTKYRQCFRSRRFVFSSLTALVMLAAALIISMLAVQYATDMASNPVSDIILSNTRVYDLDGIFVNGAILMALIMAIVVLCDPKRLPFTVKSVALFIVIRSIFISATHIGAFPTHAVINPSSQNLIKDVIGTNLYASFFLGYDSFFSGHTGLPFLMALVHWDQKWVRVLFIGISLMFGVVVLLTHLHYTIDVLSAFFISYGIYHLAIAFFPHDFHGSQQVSTP